MSANESLPSQLVRRLEDLEGRIDPAVEDALQAQWLDFWEGRFAGQAFSPNRASHRPAANEFPSVHINDAQDDFYAMACSELAGCYWRLKQGGFFPNVRCNYGVGILPSLFGVPVQYMGREFNTLPTSRPIGRDAALRLLDKGVPDVRAGLGGKVLDMAAFFMEKFRAYPKVRKYIPVYHPDIQGPMDVCELIWGSDTFTSVYEEPDQVKALLNLICETYTKFLAAFAEIVPFREKYNVHWGYLLPGKIALRDDSAMNFSPAMFDEFIAPYDQRLLDEWDGGIIHFCGRGDHYIGSMASLKGMHAILMSQPHLNDMEKILKATVDRGVAVSMPGEPARALAQKRDLRHRVIAG